MERLEGCDEDERIEILNDGNFKLDELDDEISNITNMNAKPEQKRARKLPPPSSEIRKWWVGNGKQVKVFLDTDPEEFMLNPEHTPNPFDSDDTSPLFVPRS